MQVDVQGPDGQWIKVGVARREPSGAFTAVLSYDDVDSALGRAASRNTQRMPGEWRIGDRGCDVVKTGDDDPHVFSVRIVRHKPPPAPLPPNFVLK